MLSMIMAFLFSQFALSFDARVSSKTFTESYILAEIAAQSLTDRETLVHRRFGLGGTGLLYEALVAEEIDVYPEYTGTIAETILKDPTLRSWKAVERELKKLALRMTSPLGFSNNYAIAVSAKAARRHDLKTLSDLKDRGSKLRWALSVEFASREDGWPRLAHRLGLQEKLARRVSHELAYQAIRDDQVDVIDVYTTDAKIENLKLQVLVDDIAAFPRYEAVYLVTEQFVKECPRCFEKLQSLAGKISEDHIRKLNRMADVDKQGFKAAAESFLESIQFNRSVLRDEVPTILQRTREHLVLVATTLLFATLVGIPLGFAAYRWPGTGRWILTVSGLIQTIPSLALLCLLVPLFGIGEVPALIALCLYGLLPVVANTCVGLTSLSPAFRETAAAIGLTKKQQLWLIQLPLASRSIWSGLKTSTIITIGTATLAALIGAGGFGAPIVEGLAINDVPTILTGAVPAAVLALITSIAFDKLERFVVPKGLRLSV